jgi:hypothetical protein
MKGRKGLVVLILILSLSPFQCGRKATISIPEELIGVWKTTAPPYADRFFEIKTDEVVFGTGEETFDTYPITKIKTEKDPKEQRTLYTLYYRSIEGQEYQFSFYYDPENHGTIRFKNQKEMAWTKKEASDEKSDDQTS